MARNLKQILQIVYEAGAHRVPASALTWDSSDYPALSTALSMSYIIRHESKGEPHFSLSEAGYHALGMAPPGNTVFGEIIRAFFSRTR